jgi:hypothetical protein
MTKIDRDFVSRPRALRAGLVLASVLALVPFACRSDAPLPPDTIDARTDVGPPKADAGGSGGGGGRQGGSGSGGATVDLGNDTPVAVDADSPAEGSDTAVDTTSDTPLDSGHDTSSPTCGAPGQPCCADNTCSAGGCCASGNGNTPRCVASGAACSTSGGGNGGTCSNGVCSGCGAALNQPCCAGQICGGANLACTQGQCRQCGGMGEPCCAGATCGSGFSCNGTTCIACGGPDEPCCEKRSCKNDSCCVRQNNGRDDCLIVGDTCPLSGPGNAGTCMAGKCSGCGQSGQACCNGNLCDDPAQACIAGKCQGCGGVGQAACQGNLCSGGSCVDSAGTCIAVDTACGQDSGTCTAEGGCNKGNVHCGGLDQPCCGVGVAPAGVFCTKPGTTCGPGIIAANRRCVPCGGLGQACCGEDECRVGTCSGIGNSATCR